MIFVDNMPPSKINHSFLLNTFSTNLQGVLKCACKKRIKKPIAKNIINYQGVNKMMDVALMKAVQAKEAGWEYPLLASSHSVMPWEYIFVHSCAFHTWALECWKPIRILQATLFCRKPRCCSPADASSMNTATTLVLGSCKRYHKITQANTLSFLTNTSL